ncbi:LamG-like jellyroll fold domain-containing protein [Moorena sp. SIO4G3]|uniref:LamG domain-containing protein n=1 Tax=Moorena sp. SIO4G3 TaxID=2607821 RepID=UPI00142BA854|nr:LamG-like jellyroll fold domain-containing protein [Moorena sp. SIO4G3]NEO74886.1 LamG domain-containing protein [Moorena sp. SIO4G3]
MYLLRDKVQFVNTIAHEGKVVVVATDTDGKIWYTIKQDGFEDSYLNTPEDQRTGWEDWQELEFPNEAQDDQSVIDKETKELTHQAETSTFILRTRYRTQNESAAFPVQLVSATGHLYVFRQSKANSTETTPNTLLVDRFVLDGMTNQLVRKLDVRFKRSRQKYQPIASMKKNANGGLSNIDSLDFRDADGKPFYEPTTELTLIENLHQGWFSVVLLPTNEHDKYRWHIFAYNSQTQKVELTSIRASAEGLFDFKDYTVLEPRPEAKNALIPRSIPGIIKRKLDLNGVEVANGLSATKYDIQKEQQTKDGMQLLKGSTKVMVAIPTKQGNVAALSFAVATDGTLSQIDQNPDNTNILRSQSRDLLLPLNTLDEIKAIGDSTPPPQAKITGIERGYEDRVQIVSSPSSGLKTGNTVKISNTQNYNGHYQVISIDGDTFEIAADWVNSEIGSWEVVPKTETGLVFDGIITEVERVADGKLQITALNHGLQAGDEVQIVDTTHYNGIYGITKIDDQNFTIDNLFWKPGEAVNLKLESRKRRGVMFNGVDEYIKTPALELTPPSEEFSFGYTCSAWVYVSATGSGEQIIIGEEDEHIQLLVNNGTVALKVKCANGVGQTTDTTTIPTGQWVHYAGIISSDAASDKTILTLCKNGQQVGTPTEVASLFDPPENWQPEFLIGKSFAGKIADVQVWDKVRTAKEIKDSMYLQLTGREVDLVGYWRLGAITGDTERKVVDFSVYGNDGTVYGDAFVSAITLSRTLGDGTTQAVKYSNDDLVAVSARATYIETFEFKTDPSVNREHPSLANPLLKLTKILGFESVMHKNEMLPVNPNNVDGKNGKLFTFSYWGKTSRSAKKRIDYKHFTIETSDFQSLGNDWYKATCRFTVPDGVAMIRSFELGNVKGTWSTLEIRKHRIQLLSDSITEVNYTDSVSLSTLADNYAELPGKLKILEQKEREEAVLLKEKRKLEDKIALLDNLPILQQQVAALKTEVASLQQQEQTLRSEYDQEVANPFNYECHLSVQVEKSWLGIHCDPPQPDNDGLGVIVWKSGNGNLFRFQQQENPGQAYLSVKVKNKWKKIVVYRKYNNIYYQNDDAINENIKGNLFKFEKNRNFYYLQTQVDSSWERVTVSSNLVGWMEWNTSNGTLGYGTSPFGSSPTLFKISRTSQTTNNRIQTAQTAWEKKEEDFIEKQDELTQLQDLLAAGLSEKPTLEARLQEVNHQLTQLQSDLNTANTTVINTIRTTQQTPQTLPTLHTVSKGSQKGLVTKGALLGFVSPATRIAAIESCEGNVQLSYFDNQGRMRLTNYDATSDSQNTTFEQWLPDQLPVALNFAGANDKIELANPVFLGDSWTVETWFYFGYEPERQVLMGSTDGDSPVVIEDKSKLGTRVDGVFYDSGYNLERLTPGWHHLAAVGKDSTTIFYIDGRQVADVKQAFIDAATDDASIEQRKTTICQATNIGISTIGNSTTGSEQFGKLAEIRVWNLALSEAEIAINSKTRLSGNEPGLVAYYPLNEATGTEVRDLTGSGNKSTDTDNKSTDTDNKSTDTDNKSTDTDAATIENLGHQVMQFDGVDDYIEISGYKGITGNNSRTVEAWIKTTINNPVIVSWGTDSQTKKWVFRVQNSNGTKGAIRAEVSGGYIVGNTAVNDGQWHHVACTFSSSDPANISSVQLYVDGQLDTSNTKLETQVNTASGDDVRIGTDFINRYFNGQMAEVRIWNKARTAEEIQADMSQRLTGQESGLVGYWQLNEIQSEGDQQKVLDLTGNNNHGTVKGAILFDDNTLPISSNTDSANSGTVTDAISGNNGTVIGAMWWGCAAPIGNLGHKVMQFDGVDDYVEIPIVNVNSLNISSSITIESWIRIKRHKSIESRATSDQVIFNLGNQPLFNVFGPYHTHPGILEFGWGGVSPTWRTGSQVVDDGQWHHVATTYNGAKVKIYVDGELDISRDTTGSFALSNNLIIGALSRSSSSNSRNLNGSLAEVRIWNTARTAEEIQADMSQRLTGKESGLVGYWPLNHIEPEGDTLKVRDLTGNNHGTVKGATLKDDNTLPIGSNTLVSAEYSTITIDKVTNRKSAIMRRFLASPALNGVELLPDKRIETLELKWIGNAQFAPTLLGYIEGAPPVPSENLTVEIDYTSATSVELAMSEDVEFSWNRSQDVGLGAYLELFYGAAGDVYGGIGVETKLGEWKAGFKGNLDSSYQWQNKSNITSSSALSMSDLLELRGTPESTVKFPHLGQRFIPKNVGYALVVSGLADVFITRLQRSKKMIGYQVQPVDGIPPDVNTITFLINPAYTMNGSLDGMTGSSPSSDRFFRHVPEMRAQYGSLYPASYYRLQEAYDLKQQIENEDKRRESYFAQFNASVSGLFLDEIFLNRRIDSGEAPQTIGVTREEDKPDQELTEEEKQAAQERQKEQFEEEAGAAAEKQSEAAQQKQKEIDTKITDQETRVHATDSFAGWQKKMENIQIRAGKRNIVNTYIWDADGGMRTEAQSFANTAEHTVGGSFTLNAGLGFLGEFTAGGVAGELTAQVTLNMTQTMSKTEARSKGIELYVDLSGVESKAITDQNDYPLQPGEKVDRYRFMSFYLEGSTQNFNDFFTYVVDPEWLASNDEEARALRQAKGKANKTWRVLHRVTYVERPALMGFGRNVHQTSTEDGVAIAVVNYFQDISQKQKVLESKVDQLLKMLKDIKS